MSQLFKKHVATLLELLEQSSFHLQSSISDFVQQIKTKAMECVDNNSDTKMTMKDVLAMVTSAHSTIMEHTDMFTESTKLYPLTVLTGEKTRPEYMKTADTGFVSNSSRSVFYYYTLNLIVECSPVTSRRLEDIETTISSLLETKQKAEDDISEIKQWRDNFVIKQKDIGIKIDNLSKQQKQNYKNFRKQINEQDNKIKELTQQIYSLKTKESDTEKTLEKLSLDMKEYENNLHTLYKEMRVYTDKTDHVTQEIKRHSDLISAIQENTTRTFDKLLSKHVVICKLLQQRLIPIDKIIETYNQNSKTNEEKMKKILNLEIEMLRLSNDFQSIANQQVKPSTLGFVASQGRLEGKIYDGYQVITFSAVERNIGNHFDPKTGVFTAPVDGLYKASLTIKQTGDHDVAAIVRHISGGVGLCLGDVWTRDKYVETSRTFEILIKSGDVLYLATGYTDLECSLFSCSLLNV